MKNGGSKDKGSGFEILISRKLTSWVTGSERPEIFWKTAGSGSKATMSAKYGHETKMHGDIMAIDPKGEFFTETFFVECKFYKTFDLFDLLEWKGNLYNFWIKCRDESKKADKRPLLIFKRNRGTIYTVIKYDVVDLMGLPKKSFDNIYGLGITVVAFDDLFSHLTPEGVKRLL